MKHLYYILDDNGATRPIGGMLEWADWVETQPRHIGDTLIRAGNLCYRVSTVFMGLDHAYRSEIPVLFESMVFDEVENNGRSHDVERYTSLDDAREGHEKLVHEWAQRCRKKSKQEPQVEEDPAALHPSVRQHLTKT